ncbi:MAG: putative DCC family thiol-disulfide oxidoreductase YuxK [Shewanella sp.]|jgi:predicted DCC family thiol-disulfide oxidoreductase YuxK
MKHKEIIIFDGVCNLCHGAVNFIIERDPYYRFVFTPMQSDTAKSLIAHYGLEGEYSDTFFLIKDDKCYMRTDAALEITTSLSGVWPALAILRFIPRRIRDFFYRLLGRNRYALFGRRDTCILPTDAVLGRFID